MRVEARELWDVASDCGFPTVAIGRAVVRREAGWGAACFGCPPATPAERWRLLCALEKSLLVSMPGGRARLRRWLDAPTPRMVPSERREYITEHVPAFGDESLVADVVRALLRVPAFVADAAMAEVAFMLIGGRLRGCYSGPPPCDRATIMIAGGDDVEQTAMHELAHHFTSPLERGPMAPCRARERTLALAREERWPALVHVEQRIAQDERLAEALTAIWSSR